MKIVRCIAFLVSFGAAGFATAQSAKETSGMQAVSLGLIDDAQQQFQQGNLKEVVKDLRSSATMLRIEGRRYPAVQGAMFDAGAADLDRLAAGVDDKSVNTNEKFRQAAAAALLPKARAHHATAVKQWSEGQSVRTGEEILATFHALKHVMTLADGDISKKNNEVLTRAEAASQKLLTGAAIPPTDVASVIGDIGVELDSLVKRFPASKSTH